MTCAVSFEHVTFAYPGVSENALADVTFDVNEGAFVLVTGATGSGKSTLLRAVNGLVPHFSGGTFAGDVVVAGRNTKDVAPRRMADVVAFVPQDPGSSFVVDRVEDELAYAMENLAVPATSMRRRVEEALDLLDLADLRDRSVRSLSGGEKQRVAIAAALTPGARVLVLDEPTSQLDPQGAEDVLAALHRLVHDHGMTVLLAEHRLERVAGFADAAVGCRKGAVVAGGVREVIDEIGTGPPVARLGRALGWSPTPLTVRDARRHAADLRPRLEGRDGSPAPAAGDPIVEVSGLRAAYDEHDVLHGIDLRLRTGEVVALVGRNGAGKSTLLRCIAGLHAARTGRVSVQGHDPRPGRDVALCPQAPDDLLFAERVDDEVATTLRARRSPEDPDGWLARFGIGPLAARHPRDLSAGQRLLVAVAAVAATDAPVLLLDEPTRGLDVDAKTMLTAFLTSWADEGRAVVLATHDVELVAAVGTSVVMLAGGEIVARGTPREVIGDSAVFAPQIARVFGPRWLTAEAILEAVGA